MVPIEGGTQALRRTVNAALTIRSGHLTTVSVPRPFAAAILKSAAYTTDQRNRERHLYDAAVLLACIDDPFEERQDLRGSDRRRIKVLARRLSETHPAWGRLPARARDSGQAALRILGSDAL